MVLDLILWRRTVINYRTIYGTVIELSYCYETNFVKTRNYKIERYNKSQGLYVDKNFRVTKLYVEVSSLRVLPKYIQEFWNFCKQYDCINVIRMMEKISEVAIRSSYFIYTRRKKRWENPEILKFYWTLDDVLGMVGHSLTTVERIIPTFTCDTLRNYYFTCE